jgi:hypothetical protein
MGRMSRGGPFVCTISWTNYGCVMCLCTYMNDLAGNPTGCLASPARDVCVCLCPWYAVISEKASRCSFFICVRKKSKTNPELVDVGRFRPSSRNPC